MSVYQSAALTEQQKVRLSQCCLCFELIFLKKKKKNSFQELLLQDIKINAVVGSKGRKVGPSISKKIYHVFTDEDGTIKVN